MNHTTRTLGRWYLDTHRILASTYNTCYNSVILHAHVTGWWPPEMRMTERCFGQPVYWSATATTVTFVRTQRRAAPDWHLAKDASQGEGRVDAGQQCRGAVWVFRPGDWLICLTFKFGTPPSDPATSSDVCPIVSHDDVARPGSVLVSWHSWITVM